MDDWDLFGQIRPASPPRPRRSLGNAVGAAAAAKADETVGPDGQELEEEEESLESVEDEVLSAEPESKLDSENAPDENGVIEEVTEESSASPPIRSTTSTSSARIRPSTIVINGRVRRIIDDRPSVKSLEHLPPEILEQIYRRLEGESMGNLALCCKRLYDVSFSECIWTERIEREFGIKPESYRGVGISGRLFYRHVLLPYGWSLGCWTRLVKNYGGLLSVVVENGMIVAKEVVPPENPNVEQNVTLKDVFCVKLDSKGRAKLLCLREQFNNDESAVRRRRRLYSNGQQSSSEEDPEEEKKKVRDPADKWDLFANINSDGIEWEEEKKRKEVEEARKKAEEERKAEEFRKHGIVHGVEIEFVEEAHCRKRSEKKAAPLPHFHVECLCPQSHKQDFDEFRQEDNTFRFLAMTKFDTIRSYGAKFTYQKFEVKPDFVFEGDQIVHKPVDTCGFGAAGSASGIASSGATLASGIPSSDVTSGASAGASSASVEAPGFFPLKPGIFKGTYGGHGIEFISIEKKSPYQYEAIKLSGDPNVPCGKVSFSGDLRDFLFPSEEDQLNLDKLKPMEPERQEDPNVYRTLQPYRSPPDCFVRSPMPLPDKCRARFKAEVQVSEWGYSAPQFIKAHLVVFTQDLLALIILDIKNVVLFHRLPGSEIGLPPTPIKVFRPLPVPEAAVEAAVAAAAEGVEAGVIEGPPKPRRAVFRWPPPKFHEALGDVDT